MPMTAGRVRRFAYTAAAVAAAAAVSGCGGHASSSASVRPPTAVERTALQQAVYDFVVAHTEATDPSITKMQVSSVRVGAGRAAGYAAFAKVVLSDPSAGYAAVLLGSRSKGEIQGWHVLDLGSADVGCELGTAVFGSHKQAVMRSLGLGCP
jgi:hypothetical protein